MEGTPSRVAPTKTPYYQMETQSRVTEGRVPRTVLDTSLSMITQAGFNHTGRLCAAGNMRSFPPKPAC